MNGFLLKLTNGVHGDGAIGGLAEGSGPSQVLGTNSEYVRQSLHQAANLDLQGVEKGPVDSGPVFAVNLLALNPVAQDGTTIVLGLVPRDVSTTCCHLMHTGSVGSIRRI